MIAAIEPYSITIAIVGAALIWLINGERQRRANAVSEDKYDARQRLGISVHSDQE